MSDSRFSMYIRAIIEIARLEAAGVVTEDSMRFDRVGFKMNHYKEMTERESHRMIDVIGREDGDVLKSSRLKSHKRIIIPKYLRAEKFPHFMERRNSFNSKSVLGQIHDKVESFQSLELQSKEVWKLPCFSGEVEKSCLLLWTDHYDQYRTDMKHALELDQELKNEAANRVLQKYKQILYGAAEFEESPRSREEIFNEALSIYQVNYDYANKVDDVGKCGFAWKIAGRALYALYAKMQDEDVIICSKSILHEILN
ncbi:hypothetical protein GIB67_023249 [Kingdonia uniflora]|uniref:RDRP C-terminal head domain-containing protein n=1 Tax=Kingdonia uniflora TaxID=39325 RepID=A0A7J7LJF7_9MAGN|nr:hypothetical protein GIB67_023249 [Kingdonia uniflora]